MQQLETVSARNELEGRLGGFNVTKMQQMLLGKLKDSWASVKAFELLRYTSEQVDDGWMQQVARTVDGGYRPTYRACF